MHFDNDALARSHMNKRRQMDMKALLDRGRTFEQAEKVLQGVGMLIKTPDYGVCLGGGSSGEFVAQEFLCNRWKGRIAIEGKADTLADELYDKKGEKA